MILFVLIAVHFLFFINIIINDPILSWDDMALIGPLLRIDSINSFFNRSALDIQPIRDLSYLVDILFLKKFSFSTYHLTNWFIGIFCLGLFGLISLELKVKKNYIYILMILLAFHPLYIDTISWIAARKHLLACFWILLASYLHLKESVLSIRRIIMANISYLLSILSQPIFILWPIWSFMEKKYLNEKRKSEKPKKIILYYSSLFSIMIIIASMNIYYYKFYYVNIGGGKKFHFGTIESFQLGIMAIGRYVYNIIFPIHLSVNYGSYEWQNSIGIIILLILFLLFRRISEKKLQKRILSWVLFGLMSLLIVTINMTHNFVINAYSINLLFAFFFIVVHVVNHSNLSRSFYRLSVLIVVPFYLFFSYPILISYQSDYHLFKRAYSNSPNHKNSVLYVKSLLNSPLSKEKIDQVNTGLSKIIDSKEIESIPEKEIQGILFELASKLYKRIFTNPEFSSIEKIEYLESQKIFSPYKNYYLMILYYENNKTIYNKEVCSLGTQILKYPWRTFWKKISRKKVMALIKNCP